MNIIDSNSLCGFKNRDDDNQIEKPELKSKAEEETSAPKSETINEDNLLAALAQISDTIYDDIETNDNLVAIIAEKQRKVVEQEEGKTLVPGKKVENIVIPFPKKKPTISHVKLQILSKQNLNSDPNRALDEDKVINLLNKLTKASKGETKNSRFNKVIKLATNYSLPVIMFVAGATTLVFLYTNYQSHTISKAALASYKAGNFNKANNQFSEALALNSNNTTAHFYLGCLNEDKNARVAYDHFSNALESDSINPAILEKAGKLALELELYNDAYKHYNQLLKSAPGKATVKVLTNRAIANSKLRNWEDALTDYQKVLELEPSNQNAIVGTAYCCINKNEVKAAEILLSELLNKNSKNIKARVLHGWCLMNQKKFKQASKDLSWVAKNAPGNIDGQLYYAQLLTKVGKFNQSKKQLNIVLNLDPNNYQANLLKASHLLKDKQYKEALALYKALENHPQKVENYSTLHKVSQAAINAKDNRKAIISLSKMLALKPDNARAYLDRASVYAKEKKYRRAINDAGSAINIDKELTRAYLARAQYHAKAGNEISSLNDYHKALSLDPNSIEANLAMAKHHTDNNSHASALESYKNVLATDSNNVTAKAGIDKARKTLKAMVGKITFKNTIKLNKKELKELETLSEKELVVKGYEAMQSGNLNYASKAFSKAVSLKPRAKQARRYLAHTYLAMGNPLAAQAQLQGLRALGADQKDDRITLAKAFLQCGLTSRAIKVLERHTYEYPLDLEALALLSKSYSTTGDTDKAIALCNQKLKVATTASQKARLNKLIASLKGTLKNDILMEDTNIKRSSVPVDLRG